MSEEVKKSDELHHQDANVEEKSEIEESIEKSEIEDVEINTKEVETPSVLSSNIKNHNDIVTSAKTSAEIAKEKYDEYVKADLDLEKTTVEFIQQENEIINTTINATLNLLNKLNVESLQDAQAQVTEIQKDNKEELMHIKTPTKGSAKGLLVGAIGALLTMSGSFIAGAKMANLPVNMATFMEKTSLDKIATKYSEVLNIKNTPYAGYALVAIVSLAVGYGLYSLIVWLQKKKNIKYIEKVEKDLITYTQNLNNKIEKIDELKQHIENIKLVMQKYDIILQEQNAKLRRMLFIEQPEDGINSLQRASKLEVEKTVMILDELLQLMNTPVNKGVEITQESDEMLHKANAFINEVIKKLYI